MLRLRCAILGLIAVLVCTYACSASTVEIDRRIAFNKYFSRNTQSSLSYLDVRTINDCPVKVLGWVSAHHNLSEILKTDRFVSLYFRDDDDEKEICRFRGWFAEYGKYTIKLKNSSEGAVSCTPEFDSFKYPPSSSSSEVVPTLLIVVICLFILIQLLSYFIRASILGKCSCCNRQQSSLCESENVELDSSRLVSIKTDKGREKTSSSTSSRHRSSNGCCRLLSVLQERATITEGRYYSLDTFRGITVALMIFVNAGGGKYQFMKHATWDHMTIADLPHPWFNWIMGMTIAVSGSTERVKCSVRQRISRVLSRFAKLFLLGLTVSSESFTTDLNRIPLLGVLQDLALLYLVVATLEIVLPRFEGSSGSKYVKLQASFLQRLTVNDCFFYLTRAIAALTPLIVYLSVVFGLNVPGCGRGYLGPGGVHLDGKYKNCTGGAPGYIDRMIIGENHLAFSLPYASVYDTKVNHDSYGPFCLLSQMTQVYLGVIAGEMLVRNRSKNNVIIVVWSVFAVILFAGAWLLCNDLTGFCLMPLSRRLWSVTFIMVTSAIGLVAMIILYVCIEVTRMWTGSPFYYPGTNSVAIYIGHKLAKNVFPFCWTITNGTHVHFLFMHLWQTVLWIIISIMLYRKRIFLRV